MKIEKLVILDGPEYHFTIGNYISSDINPKQTYGKIKRIEKFSGEEFAIQCENGLIEIHAQNTMLLCRYSEKENGK